VIAIKLLNPQSADFSLKIAAISSSFRYTVLLDA
jgi:hypothetical protein